MTGRLLREIGQTKPFESLEVEAFLNVLRTAAVLERGIAELLRENGLTHQQYNVLRILRGAGPEGLPAMEIGCRMVTREPDVTRLVDRLVAAGMAERNRARHDRRVVKVRITARGRSLLKTLARPISRFHTGQLGHLGEDKLRALIDLLEEARGAK